MLFYLKDINCIMPNTNSCKHIMKEYIRARYQADGMQLALVDSSVLDAIFLSTCQCLENKYTSSQYTALALEYKGACIRSINKAISQKTEYSDATIAVVLALASDSVSHQCCFCLPNMASHSIYFYLVASSDMMQFHFDKSQSFDEALTASHQQCVAVITMIQAKCGLQALGGDRFLKALVKWVVTFTPK
jgi:hypothetical protein